MTLFIVGIDSIVVVVVLYVVLMLLVVVAVMIELQKCICYQKCNSKLNKGKNSSYIVIKRETL